MHGEDSHRWSDVICDLLIIIYWNGCASLLGKIINIFSAPAKTEQTLTRARSVKLYRNYTNYTNYKIIDCMQLAFLVHTNFGDLDLISSSQEESENQTKSVISYICFVLVILLLISEFQLPWGFEFELWRFQASKKALTIKPKVKRDWGSTCWYLINKLQWTV